MRNEKAHLLTADFDENCEIILGQRIVTIALVSTFDNDILTNLLNKFLARTNKTLESIYFGDGDFTVIFFDNVYNFRGQFIVKDALIGIDNYDTQVHLLGEYVER